MSDNTTVLEKNERPLNEVVNLTVANVHLQTQGKDVMIPYIIGAPGGGKTASIYGMCKELGYGLVSTHFALKPLEETGGIPQFEKMMVNGKELLATVWSFPDIMKQLYKVAEEFKNSIVVWLLDDSHLLSNVHNAMLYELLTERKLREYKIPDNVGIVMAGNHASNKAGARTMFSAIVNRVFFLPCYTDFDNWKINFAMQYGVHPSITSFLENDTYSRFFHEEEQVDTPWGSPRSWTRLSTFLKELENWQNRALSTSDILYITSGHVSKEAAANFQTYYEIFSKFDIPDIIKTADAFTVPTNPIDRYALAYAITSHYAGTDERKKITSNFSKILHKYISDYQDLGLMMIHEIINIEKILNKRNLFIDVSMELNKIEPGITEKLLKEVTSV